MRAVIATGTVIASALLVATAGAAINNVPTLDVAPSCKAAVSSGLSLGAGRTEQSCLNDEKAARQDLVKDWSTFGAEDRSHCLSLISTGGGPSYVELLSCLEMSRDAKKIARGEQLGDMPPPRAGPRKSSRH